MTLNLFYFLSFVAVFSALLVVFSKNPVYSVLYLIITFFAIAGHYVLLNAEFLAAVLFEIQPVLREDLIEQLRHREPARLRVRSGLGEKDHRRIAILVADEIVRAVAVALLAAEDVIRRMREPQCARFPTGFTKPPISSTGMVVLSNAFRSA